MKHRSLIAQLLAATLVLGLVTQVRGAPADIAVSAAPMLGADPPKGTELRDGDSSVSTQTGALQYSYPIDVPPGRLGNQPSLALTYSSQAPLYGGIAAGWTLTIPEIRRDTSQGVLRPIGQNTTSQFLSTMAGSRPLVAVSEPAQGEAFRAQNDTTYTRYERMPDTSSFAWAAYAPDGTSYFFGDLALVDGGIDFNRVPLTRTVDPFGNTVEYRWLRTDANELLIQSIEYASNAVAGLLASARVDFIYGRDVPCSGELLGAATSYRTGRLETSGSQRLDAVQATAFDPASQTVGHTRLISLGYDEDCGDGSSGARLLTSIQESAWGASAPRVDLPAVTFEYGDARRTDWEVVDHGPWFQGTGASSALAYGRRFLGSQWPTVDAMFADLDGDGLEDRLISTYTDETCAVEWARNTGAGFAPVTTFPLPHLEWRNASPLDGCSLNGQQSHPNNVPDPVHGGFLNCPSSDTGTYLSYRWLDITGDGLVDLVTAIHHDPSSYDPDLGPVPRFSFAPGSYDPGSPQYEPVTSWPESEPSCRDRSACPVPEHDCVVQARFSCPGEPDVCGFDLPALQTCVNDADDVGCANKLACGPADLDPDCNIQNFCDLPQIAHEECGAYPWMIYANQGGGRFPSQPEIKLSPIPLESYSGDSPSGAGPITSGSHALIDLDGDGILDAVTTSWLNHPPNFNTPILWWYVWKGDGTGGFAGDVDGNPFLWFVPGGARPSFGDAVRLHPEPLSTDFDQILSANGGLTDFNGDGLLDYYWRKHGSDDVRVWWNNGNRFLSGTDLLGEGEVSDLSRTLLDVTLRDDTTHFIMEARAEHRSRLMDYDADGRVDLLYTERNQESGEWSDPEIRFNTGSDFGPGYSLTDDENFALISTSRALPALTWETARDFVDIDGDGLGEHIFTAGNTLTKIRNPPTGHPARLMKAFHNGQGLHVAVEYAPLSDAEVVTSDPTALERASPQTKWVVRSTTTTDDYEATPSTMSYRYAYPKWSPDDRGDWGFRGFETVRTTNAREAVVEERYRYDVDWSGRLAATLTFPAEAPAEPTVIADTEWQRYTLFGGAIETFHPTVSRTWTCANGENESSCRARTPTNPNNGMVRDEQVWTALASTTGSDPTPLLYARTRQYRQHDNFFSDGDRFVDTAHAVHADATTYRVRPTSMVSTWLQGTALEVFAKSETLWDPTFRVALEERVYFDESEYAATTRSYEMETGVVLTVTKPEQLDQPGSPHTTFTYDDLRLFVTLTTNELGHVVLTNHDRGTGALLRTTGPNAYACTGICPGGLAEQRRTDIDGLGRPIATYVSRNGAGHYDLVKVADASYVDTPVGAVPTSVTVRRLVQYDDSRWTEDETSFDGHGRLIGTRKSGGAADAITTFDYGVDGKLGAVTVPNPSPDGGFVTFMYTFDSLGRPTSLRRPDGGSGADLTYDGLSSTTTEVSGPGGGPVAITELVNDDFGRLIAVNEGLEGGAVATTTYGYDPRDTVDLVVDPEGVTTTMVHDFAGRRTGITRGDRAWALGYDRNGNLIFERSPVPDGALATDYTTMYAYDALDRLKSKLAAPRDLSQTERERYGVNAMYEYDTTADGLNRVGRLFQVGLRGPGYNVLRTTLSYDAEGNVTEDRRDFNFAVSNAGAISGSRRLLTTYAPGGRVRTVDFGDGPTTDDAATLARFGYDDRADPILVEVQRAGQPWATAAALTRNIPGMVTERRRPGAPVQKVRWKYDELGLIRRVHVTVGGADVVDQRLTYWGGDDPKTLEHIAQGLDTRNFRFRYDERHQLVRVETEQDTFNARYRLTEGGRLGHVLVNASAAAGSDVRNREVTYRYMAADPEMLSSLRNEDGTEFAHYRYDDAGNVDRQEVQGVVTRLHWDGEDQLRRAVTDAGKEDYFYDHTGTRVGVVKRDATNAITQVKYFQGPLEVWLAPNATPTTRLAHVALGTPVARVESPGTATSSTMELQYHGPLQSLLASVSTSGTVNSAFAYGPYGEVLQAAGAQAAGHRRRYNDKHQDELTNLLYYGVRFFDSVALVWKSADPKYRFAPDAAWRQPRRAALYLFNLGNPLRYLDPDGRDGFLSKVAGAFEDLGEGVLQIPAAIDTICSVGPEGVVKAEMEIFPQLPEATFSDALAFATALAITLVVPTAIAYAARAATAADVAIVATGGAGIEAATSGGTASEAARPGVVWQGDNGFGEARYTWEGGGEARFTANGSNVDVGYVRKGTLVAEGDGGRMLADALRASGVSQPTTLTTSNVLQKRSTSVDVIENMFRTAASELGGTVINVTRGKSDSGENTLSVEVAY